MKIILLLFVCLNVFALDVPEAKLSESLGEKKRGNQFLQFIWQTGTVVEDIESTTYLRKLGHELAKYSQNPNKHFAFLFLNNDDINAFAGPYGYIGVHTGLLLALDSEAELAGVLAHEISHITQNHLQRFSEKANQQNYFLLAGLLLAALLDNSEATEAVAATSIANSAQQNINFTREHEQEADRIGTSMLIKSNFNPRGMAEFFAKLKDSANAAEFLRSHPLSVNRIADSLQRVARKSGNYRQDSFAYKVARGKLYYHKHGRIKLEKDLAISHYMQAYHAFEKQKYHTAKQYVGKLLALNQDKPSNILAGRIYAKLGNIKQAQQYFRRNNLLENDEASIYYAAKAYADNRQLDLAIATLKPFLRVNQGGYASYQLLASLFVKQGAFDRAHIYSAQSLIVRGDLGKAIGHYKRAKSLTHSQDLFDVLSVKIQDLQQTLDLYGNLP